MNEIMTRRELIDFCLTFESAYEDYPFADIAAAESWTVMRHRSNKKSFALIYEKNSELCVNLKCDPFEADILRQMYSGVIPAFHMNKVHWNTVLVGSDVSENDLKRMIDQSYNLIKPKTRKKA